MARSLSRPFMVDTAPAATSGGGLVHWSGGGRGALSACLTHCRQADGAGSLSQETPDPSGGLAPRDSDPRSVRRFVPAAGRGALAQSSEGWPAGTGLRCQPRLALAIAEAFHQTQDQWVLPTLNSSSAGTRLNWRHAPVRSTAAGESCSMPRVQQQVLDLLHGAIGALRAALRRRARRLGAASREVAAFCGRDRYALTMFVRRE